jgi:hypothetical protein
MELYSKPCSKKDLATKFEVTTKTIENTISDYSSQIILDRKIGAYRFNNLLPDYIPYNVFFKKLNASIANEVIKNDFMKIGHKAGQRIDLPMIPTEKLSELTKKIISISNGINSNAILKIDYIGNDKPLESKYVIPHTIISTGFTYYLLCEYDKKNEKDVGQNRSLALNGMLNLEAVEYIKNGNFEIDKSGNAYGYIDQSKYVTLKLKASSANFFKREGQFSKENFDFISEDIDGTVTMKMYYNNIQEIVQIIQSWMPYISIDGHCDIYDIVYKQIEKNYFMLIN